MYSVRYLKKNIFASNTRLGVEDNGMVIALVCKVWDVLDNAFIKELQNSFSLIGEFYAIAKVFRMIKPEYKRRYIFLVFTIVSKLDGLNY